MAGVKLNYDVWHAQETKGLVKQIGVAGLQETHSSKIFCYTDSDRQPKELPKLIHSFPDES